MQQELTFDQFMGTHSAYSKMGVISIKIDDFG